MEYKKINRYHTIGFIMFVVLAIISFGTSKPNKVKNVYMMEKYKSQIELNVTLDYQLAEQGAYNTDMIGDKFLILSDNISRSVYTFDLEDQKAEKRLDYPEFGSGYIYDGKLHTVYDRYLDIWDEDYNKVYSEPLFVDSVYSRVYKDNIAIVSLYRSKGIFAMDLDTKEIVWSIEDQDRINNHMKLTISDNILYYLDAGTIYGISPLTGEVLSEIEGKHYQPYLIEENYMYTSGSNLKRVDMRTWETVSETEINVYLIRVDENNLYVIDRKDGNFIKKYNKYTLETYWKTELFDSGVWDIAFLDDYLAVENVIGQVALLNKSTGSVDWLQKFESDTNIFGYNENLVIVGDEGRIRYFDTSISE